MANTIRIKRSTSTAAPATLANAELAYSENSDKLFIGIGTGGAGGTATTVLAIGGPGAFMTLDTNQTIGGTKTFSNAVFGGTPSNASHLTTKAYVDTQDATKLNSSAVSAFALTFLDDTTAGDVRTTLGLGTAATSASTAFAAATHSHAISDITNLQSSLDLKASITYVDTKVSDLVASAPAALNTLNELAVALGNDASFSTTITTALGNRLRVDVDNQGLSATQQGYGRTNLGLGTIATQNANSVTLTGGSLDNFTIDGGSFS